MRKQPPAGRLGKFAYAILVLALTFSTFSLSSLPALAGTTGVISGIVTDASTGVPIAGVKVTAASPSGSYSATTDAHGFYSMAGVYADTYTVSFQKDGYSPISSSGQTVLADQVASVPAALASSLKTIAVVHAHSNSSAFQPNQTTNTVTVNATQIQQIQGTDFDFSETNLLTSLPGVTLDRSGYPVIHGGREYEEGFEFEGIPYTDAYSNQFTNSLAIPTSGIGLVQLTPGAGDASQAGGGTGNFNVVSKRGTYPGYTDFGAAIGGGDGFRHSVQMDSSWATPDGKFSNYASFAGANQGYEFDHGNLPDAAIGEYFNRRMEVDREFLDNAVFRFGKDNGQSVQAFVDLAEHDFYLGSGGLNGLLFPTGDPLYTGTFGAIFGLTPTQIAEQTQLYPGQSSIGESLVQAADRAPETTFQPNQAFKLEYTNNFNSSTFFSAKFYRVNSVVTFDIPNNEGTFYNDSYVLQGGQTTGLTLSLQKQLNDSNLFEVGFDTSRLHPIDAYRSDGLGLLSELTGTEDENGIPYAFVNPSQACLLGAGNCGYAYQGANANATQLLQPNFDQTPSENRQDLSAYVKDKLTAGTKFTAEVGARVDAADYRADTPGVNPYYCTTEYAPATWTANPAFNPSAPLGNGNCPYNATFNVNNNELKPIVLQPRVALSYHLAPNTALRLTYDRGVQFAPITEINSQVSPGAYINAYGNLGPYNAFGDTYLNHPGPIAYASSLPYTLCGMTGYQVPCQNFGEQLYWANQNFDGVPYQPVLPTTTDNYEATLEQQFTKGLLNGVAVSVSPWYRFQHNTIGLEASPILGANGQPLVINGQFIAGTPLATNAGKEFGSGVDLNITREREYGISAQVTASYINEFSSVIPTSASEDFFPSIIPASILAGNVYRVGFLSPFQSTFAFSYKTQSGWRINPRYTWNIGYPTGLGELAPAVVNGVALNLPNTNGLIGSAPSGPAYFIDPENPGSVFAPNIVATRGNAEAASPGGKLTRPDSTTDLTIEFSPPKTKLTYGLNINNLFDETYSGAVLNGRYQPIATGIAGPLTGYSVSGSDYQMSNPAALPYYTSPLHGNQVYVDVPNGFGRNLYFYIQARL